MVYAYIHTYVRTCHGTSIGMSMCSFDFDVNEDVSRRSLRRCSTLFVRVFLIFKRC